MQQDLSTAAMRFKKVRESLGFTQQEFAQKLGISNSTADIERAKTKLSGAVVMELLRQFQINPLWLYGKSISQYLSPEGVSVMPKVITVNDADQENILLVSQRAAAGYPQNVGDPEWVQTLPAFSIPLPQYRNATYRGFQVEGDSMLPNIRPNEWVLGRSVGDLGEATNNKIYIVVLQDSVLVKKLEKLADPSKVRLVSLNAAYLPIDVPVQSIQELWLVNSKISFGLESDGNNSLLQQLQDSMDELKGQINRLQADE
ncbi:XRE family transcriptional regulator [Gilvibacter sediminis]|uniref:XRE family transcriptional regulator n=1 Tax=Gilvibacter sediminis TaxID=379071 RepID=UPI00235047DC|nr:LexA family transcriptional regulator [Gilvibacter sediminis]MDC7998734.1 S24 family peptidase [Gilvibacter sediminis]